jgi:transcriptional regulator with XRE-family HTH domain
MKNPQTLRNKLGLSQDEMAFYLGITRSQVNMLEQNQRLPSTAVLQREAWLEIEIIKPNKNISATVQQQMQQFNKKQRDKLSKLKTKYLQLCTAAQRRLTKMEEIYQQALLLLQVIAGLRTNTQLLQSDNAITVWLDATERTALQKLKKNSLAEQAILKAKIKALTAQSNELTAFMM